MLYCPKCQRTYEEGAQRFCTADNARLLPAPSSDKSTNSAGGVFTGIFNRAASSAALSDDKFSSAPTSFAENDASQFQRTAFRPPTTSKIFKPEDKVEQESKISAEIRAQIEKSAPPPFELSLEIPNEKPLKKPSEKPFEENAASPVQKNAPSAEKTALQKPLPRFVKLDEMSESRATLGDRKKNPTGRLALTRENPEVLIGQIIKGRYQITEKVGADASSLAYSAHDKIGDRRVAVRILMDEDAHDYFADKNFAEERIMLSHVNHPSIASVVDSGELPEGKPFIVTEYVAGKTVREMLIASGQFNALRAARIVRQASYALSEVHQSGILHRGLTPENIFLIVSEKGAEQVKLTDFGVSHGTGKKGENLAYSAPEQVGGKGAAAIAGDVYSLAVIAFEMLTNRLPFDASSPNNLLRAQRIGLSVRASDLRLDVAPVVDEILEKALAFNPSERYAKTRDFGDAFFNAVTTAALWEGDETEKIEIIDDENSVKQNSIERNRFEPNQMPETSVAVSELRGSISGQAENLTTVSGASAKIVGERAETAAAVERTTSNEDLLWERRSPEPPTTAKMNWAMTTLFGAIVALSAFGLWYFMQHRQSEPEFTQNATPIVGSSAPEQQQQPLPEAPAQQQMQPTAEIESPPLPRTIMPPQNFVYFVNSKQNLKSETAKNFLGFSLYYPKDWKQNDAKNNFLDVSKNAPSGTPVEQILVSFYNSKGTFNSDKETFPTLVKETNATLAKIVPNFKAVSNGETTVNGGWRAYEVKFAGAGKTAQGENIKLWGRRLFIPAARNGMKNGYVLTMLATSFSPDVKSVDDVGVKGDLNTVLDTFEPNQNF